MKPQVTLYHLLAAYADVLIRQRAREAGKDARQPQLFAGQGLR